MEKKAKILATLGPSIYNESKLNKLVELGVDAFRINFSHDTSGIKKIISRIRKIEKRKGKKISLIADLQGIKLRIGKIKNGSQKIRFNQKFILDNRSQAGNNLRVNFPYSKVLKKLKKGNKILIDDGKFLFSVIGKSKNSIITKCKSHNCIIRSNKGVHIPNLNMSLIILLQKIKKTLKQQLTLVVIGLHCLFYKMKKLFLKQEN